MERTELHDVARLQAVHRFGRDRHPNVHSPAGRTRTVHLLRWVDRDLLVFVSHISGVSDTEAIERRLVCLIVGRVPPGSTDGSWSAHSR